MGGRAWVLVEQWEWIGSELEWIGSELERIGSELGSELVLGWTGVSCCSPSRRCEFVVSGVAAAGHSKSHRAAL